MYKGTLIFYIDLKSPMKLSVSGVAFLWVDIFYIDVITLIFVLYLANPW